MSGEKKPKEFWIDADLGQVLRVKPFSSDSVRFSHVIEMKAYLALQQELDAARESIKALRHELRMQTEYGKQLADVQEELKLCKDGWATVSSNYLDAQDKLEHTKAQIADYEAALEAITKRHDWHPDLGQCICEEHKKATETLNKWKSK